MKRSRLMRMAPAMVVIALVAAACVSAEDSDPIDQAAATTTTERLEVLDHTITTGPSVIPRDETTATTVFRSALRPTPIVVTPTTTSSTTTTTTTTTPATPIVTFPDVPPLSIFEAAKADAVHVVSDPYSIDPGDCEGVIWTASGSDWSAFVVTEATADGYCEIWLGGATDNADYTGNPYLYCLLADDHDSVAVASDTNPGWVSEAGLCAQTGFDQG